MGEGKLWRKEDTKRKDIPHVLKETKQRESNIPEDRVEDMGEKIKLTPRSKVGV